MTPSGWFSAYVIAGILFCLWNARSRFFQTVAANLKANGQPWVLFIALLVGVFIWPLGALVSLVGWIRVWKRGH